ncbi:hypothetical protein J120_04755 [candidate division TM6 bacterium JCVI TM6SC1]|uniref:Uncharacterized protein n=1 Tax=candidate division TM6 bacterium JCVI TM6SC1 TaxID=1306947 RepID=A0A0D2JD56_9BACT|nr:hypothetical protein J120_04755 [candidate division TM6 bacterium JCVI TM6SC1]
MRTIIRFAVVTILTGVNILNAAEKEAPRSLSNRSLLKPVTEQKSHRGRSNTIEGSIVSSKQSISFDDNSHEQIILKNRDKKEKKEKKSKKGDRKSLKLKLVTKSSSYLDTDNKGKQEDISSSAHATPASTDIALSNVLQPASVNFTTSTLHDEIKRAIALSDVDQFKKLFDKFIKQYSLNTLFKLDNVTFYGQNIGYCTILKLILYTAGFGKPGSTENNYYKIRTIAEAESIVLKMIKYILELNRFAHEEHKIKPHQEPEITWLSHIGLAAWRNFEKVSQRIAESPLSEVTDIDVVECIKNSEWRALEILMNHGAQKYLSEDLTIQAEEKINQYTALLSKAVYVRNILRNGQLIPDDNQTLSPRSTSPSQVISGSWPPTRTSNFN